MPKYVTTARTKCTLDFGKEGIPGGKGTKIVRQMRDFVPIRTYILSSGQHQFARDRMSQDHEQDTICLKFLTCCQLELTLASARNESEKIIKIFRLFSIFSLALIRTCKVNKGPQIFLTRYNYYIQENNWQFDGTLNHFGHIVFADNQY